MELTDENMIKLLSDVKTYLNITWHDEAKEAQLKLFIKSSIAKLESIYGYSLSFVDIDQNSKYANAENLAYELLLPRVFYMNEKALDDFESNYTSELLKLYRYGQVRSHAEQ